MNEKPFTQLMAETRETLRQLEIARLNSLGLITEGPGPRCEWHEVLLDARGCCSVCDENDLQTRGSIDHEIHDASEDWCCAAEAQ